MSDKNIIVSVAIFLLAIGVAFYTISGGNTALKSAPVADEAPLIPDENIAGNGASAAVVPSSPVATFAQCLKDSGTVFYGAFWCPHCTKQKALFRDAVSLLPYVECSSPDGNSQLQICKDKHIDGYPTWEFADGSRISGERTFAELAEKSGCAVPLSE